MTRCAGLPVVDRCRGWNPCSSEAKLVWGGVTPVTDVGPNLSAVRGGTAGT